MKKVYISAGILFLAAITGLDALFLATGNIMFKAGASFMFSAESVLCVILCAKKKVPMKFPLLMMTAIILAFAADVVIECSFLLGALLFGIGHIFYFASYCRIEKFSPKDLIPSAISAVGLLIIIMTVPILNFKSTLIHIAICIYAVIISLMVGKSISDAIRSRNVLNIIIMAGSVLFWISDFALMFYIFGNIGFANYICLFTYYPAQFILAMTPLIFANSRAKS